MVSKFFILAVIAFTLSLPQISNAAGALFQTSDFAGLCPGSNPVTIPRSLQGKFIDRETNGWIEVGEKGVSAVEWKQFNFHSRGFVDKGYCLEHEFENLPEGEMTVRLTLTKKNDGFVSNKEAYMLSVSMKKDASYFANSKSSGSVKVAGFLPILGGSTAISKEVPLIRETPPERTAKGK
jgi:hypothetical protein